MIEGNHHLLSDYAKFHVQFMGYDFFDNYKQRIVNKYALWHSHHQLCLTMLKTNHIISRYTLKDRYGWKGGLRIRRF